MRKDLILAAALSGLVVTAWADPGGPASSTIRGQAAPAFQGTRVDDPAQVTDRNAAESGAPIAGEITNSGDRSSPGAQEFRREAPGTLGARGTIGQDATGFTGQERIGTPPPVGLGTSKKYDGSLDRAEDALKADRAARDAASPAASGSSGGAQTGRASQNDLVFSGKAASDAGKGLDSGSVARPAEPAGLAGQGGRYNGTAGDAHADINSNTSTEHSAPAGVDPAITIETDNSSNDSQMSNRIRQSLMSRRIGRDSKISPNQLQNIQITSTHGAVTLTGSVATPAEKRDLEATIKQMRGVTSVENRLTIKGGDGATDNQPQPDAAAAK